MSTTTGTNHQAANAAPAPRWRISRQELALIAVTIVWGSTFLIVHLAMRHCGPLFFVGVRFVAAGAMSWVVFGRGLRAPNRRELVAGAAIGLSICLGYGLQTLGLKTISSSQSAFITALYVPIVPLLQLAVLRRPVHLMGWVSVVLAFIGLVLLAGPDAGRLSFSPGEVATLLGAVAIAAEVILISRFANEVDSRQVTIVQLFAAGLFSLAGMPLVGEALPGFSWIWLSAALGLGAASAVIQLTMNWAQKSISPTKATVIYAGEPVWGGVFGRLGGDRLPPLALAGAGLIVAGVVLSEIRPKRPGAAED